MIPRCQRTRRWHRKEDNTGSPYNSVLLLNGFLKCCTKRSVVCKTEGEQVKIEIKKPKENLK